MTVRSLAPPVSVALGVDKLLETFARHNFDLAVADGAIGAVPRLYVANLPADLTESAYADKRKIAFKAALLPLILKVNEDIMAERRRLLWLAERLDVEDPLAPAERLWLDALAARYGVAPDDIDALKERVDVVPPSLALAQAAEESGWGTSRFARLGNAVFGQRIWRSGSGIRPLKRARGERFEIRIFSELADAVAAYMHNLNTHHAYNGFRSNRAWLRALGRAPSGDHLVGELAAYSVRGADYIEALRTIMQKNDLGRFDASQLSEGWIEAGGARDSY